MADELERARTRENKLAEVFSAIDTLNAAQLSLGNALNDLRGLGVAQTDLAELSGLSVREVSAAVKASKTRGAQNNEQNSVDNGAAGSSNHAGEAGPSDTES